MSTSILLEDLSTQFRNVAWIASESEELYQYINDGLQNKETVDDATNALLMIYPRLMEMEDLQKWHKLIEKALRKAVDSRPRRSSRNGQDAFVIGDSFVIERLDHGEVELMPGKRRRPRFRLNPRKLLEDYLILVTSLVYRSSIQMDNERVNDLLEFSRRVNNPHTSYKTYQTLAFIYNRQGQFAHALTHAELSFRYFAEQDNALEAGLAAYAAAAASYAPPHPDASNARYWLEIASDQLARTEFARQFGAIPLLESTICMVEGKYPQMLQAAKVALDEYQMMNLQGKRGKYYRAASNQLIGTGYSMQKQVDEAFPYFEKALDLWQEADEPLRYEETSLAIAFTLALAEDIAAARERIAAGVAALEAMDAAPYRDYLLNYAATLTKAIDEGTVEAMIR